MKIEETYSIASLILFGTYASLSLKQFLFQKDLNKESYLLVRLLRK